MSESEVWSVALAPDNIQTLTLDQLDAAFQRGLIPETALVWTEGMDEWLRLRDVMGEDEPAPVALAPARAVPSAFPPVATRQPVAAHAPVATRPSVPMRAPISVMPSSISVPPNSVAPVAMSLGSDDLELGAFGGGSNKAKWAYFAAAAVVVAGAGFTIANVSASGGLSVDPTQAAAAAMPIPAGDEPLAAPVAKDPNAPLAGGGYTISAAEEKRFKDEAAKAAEQRERIAAALAANPPEEKAKKHRPPRSQRANQSNASGIKKGGAKYDPLNGALP